MLREGGWRADLETEIGRSLPDESEGSAHMDPHDDVERVVWGCVKHLVECEPSFVP